MKKLIILGGSGIGIIASYIAEITKEYFVQGFLNDYIEPGQFVGKYKKYPILGKSDDISKYLSMKDYYFFVAYIGMKNELSIYNKINELKIPFDRFANLIHPTAIIPKGYVKLGKGILIAPLAQLSPDVSIDNNCILLGNSFLGHDSIMKRYSHLTTNSVVGGSVTLGKAVHIGSNATIKEKVRIGDFSLVGSGSVVLKDVPENVIVVGNPAKIIKHK